LFDCETSHISFKELTNTILSIGNQFEELRVTYVESPFRSKSIFVATRISHYIKECRKFNLLDFSITLYILGPYNAYCPVIAPFNFSV
jgi:hypothetical protein